MKVFMSGLLAVLFLVSLIFSFKFSENTAVCFALLFAAFACIELFVEWAGIQDGWLKKAVLTIGKAFPVIVAILLAFHPNL